MLLGKIDGFQPGAFPVIRIGTVKEGPCDVRATRALVAQAQIGAWTRGSIRYKRLLPAPPRRGVAPVGLACQGLRRHALLELDGCASLFQLGFDLFGLFLADFLFDLCGGGFH